MNILLSLKKLGTNILLHIIVFFIIIIMKIYNTTIDFNIYIQDKLWSL